MWHWNVRKKHGGFTLIEMLVTVIIIGVIAAIATPNLLGLLNRNRVKEGLAGVEGAIKEAQRQAIRNGKTCKIKLITTTVDGNTRVLVTKVLNSDTGEDASADYTSCLLEDRVLPVGVTTTTTITGTPTKITFSSKGNTDSTSQGLIIVSHNGSTTQKCLEINGTLGNIRTGDFNGSNCISLN